MMTSAIGNASMPSWHLDPAFFLKVLNISGSHKARKIQWFLQIIDNAFPCLISLS
jgi:hypothetical protein